MTMIEHLKVFFANGQGGNVLKLTLFTQYLAFEPGPPSLDVHLHSLNMPPCTAETSSQQKPHQSPKGEWNCSEMRIDIWFMFTSFAPINREDIFISVFVETFHKKKRHPFSRLINTAVRRFYF